MVRGSTPTNTFDCDINLTDASVIYITYVQNEIPVIEKTGRDITVNENVLTVTLSPGAFNNTYELVYIY